MIDLHASKKASSSAMFWIRTLVESGITYKEQDQILFSWLNIFYLIVAKSVVNYIIFP